MTTTKGMTYAEAMQQPPMAKALFCAKLVKVNAMPSPKDGVLSIVNDTGLHMYVSVDDFAMSFKYDGLDDMLTQLWDKTGLERG